jgi:hypothetical protein
MKRSLIVLVFISMVVVTGTAQQSNGQKIDPVGIWKFEAPYAPDGYTSGIVRVGRSEQKPTAAMSFTGSEYKLNGDKVKIANDSILFSVSLEGQEIKVLLKVESEISMSGKAVYSEGEVPLTLKKSVDQASISQ